MLGAEPGDLILVLSGEEEKTRKQMGELRLEMGRRMGLMDPTEFKPLWVVDFPLLEWDEDSERFHAMHHPFTSPKKADMERMLNGDHETMKALRADAYDLVISSAMDLQTKLANDGHVQRHSSEVTREVPAWAKWNDMVFAFTQEPAAIVVSDAAFAAEGIPRSRQDLIDVLRRNPERFRGKVGTYDVRESGLGYLFATQESRVSETYWRLTEVMGGLGARLYCCSSQMIDAVSGGDLFVAYNVLGSYALQRQQFIRSSV